MNATARAANRAFLLVTGLLLVAAGAVAVALPLLSGAAGRWRQALRSVRDSLPVSVTAPVAGTVGWFAIGVAAASLVLALVLVAFVLRQGRGHTATLLDRRSETDRTRIDLAVPRTLLAEHLAQHPDIVASRVTAYAVRGTPTLKVSVRARRGVSPTALAADVTDALRTLDTVLGTELPAYVQLSGGFRTRTAARARVA